MPFNLPSSIDMETVRNPPVIRGITRTQERYFTVFCGGGCYTAVCRQRWSDIRAVWDDQKDNFAPGSVVTVMDNETGMSETFVKTR